MAQPQTMQRKVGGEKRAGPLTTNRALTLRQKLINAKRRKDLLAGVRGLTSFLRALSQVSKCPFEAKKLGIPEGESLSSRHLLPKRRTTLCVQLANL